MSEAGAVFYGLQRVVSVHPVIERVFSIAGRALLRFARGTAAQKPRGQGGGAPNKRRDKHPAPNHANHARGRAPPAPPISLARACQRGRRIKVPFCLSKMGHLRKAC